MDVFTATLEGTTRPPARVSLKLEYIVNTSFMERLLDALNQNRLVLPAFPEAAMRARDVAERLDASALDVAKEVAKDPALTARILKVANSSMFGFRQNTGSLQQAISRMGLDHTKTLVTNFALMQLMAPPKAAYGKLIARVRTHCAEVAAVGYTMAEVGGRQSKNRALLAGMLHDIGYLPLIQFAKNEPDELLLDPAFMAELKELHLQVGNMLMMYWQFAPDLMNTVSDHHNLACDYGPDVSLREVVALANAWVRADEVERAELLQSELAEKVNVTGFGKEQDARIGEIKRFFS